MKSKEVIAYSLDPIVIARIDDMAQSLGISASCFANLQLRVALGMIDEVTSNFMNGKGLTITKKGTPL